MLMVKKCSCGHINPEKELTCAQCLDPLPKDVEPMEGDGPGSQTPEESSESVSGDAACTCSADQHCFICKPGEAPLSMVDPAPVQAGTPEANQPLVFELVFSTGRSVAIGDGLLLGRASGASPGVLSETKGKRGVSRLHAWVGPIPGGVVVVDLCSTNGTLLNGERLARSAAHIVDYALLPLNLTLGRYFNLTLRCMEEE